MIVLCIKSSHVMGMGHLFRMLNLYSALSDRGETAAFVLLGNHAPAEAQLARRGITYTVFDESTNDWELQAIKLFLPCAWVNDRLNTTPQHVSKIKNAGIPVMTFDDDGEGAILSDIHVAPLAKARGLAVVGERTLTSMDYLILSPDIARYRRVRYQRQKIVVNLGGSDTYGVTVTVASWLAHREIAATIILGPGFQHITQLRKLPLPNIEIKSNVPSLVAEFAAFDFAITGGGITSFEAAAAGLPTLTIANEPHEIGYCEYLQSLGCSVFAGFRGKANLHQFEVIENIENMSRSGMHHVPISGTTNVCEELIRMQELNLKVKI